LIYIAIYNILNIVLRGRRYTMTDMIDNSKKYKELREKYPNFIYDSYKIEEDNENIYITFKFEIEGLTTFNPTLIIKKKNYIKESIINNNIVKNLVFNIGLVELISYWKSTFSKNLIIKAGHINEDQIKWFKKLYYLGLGELRYTNNIEISEDKLMNIKSIGEELNIENDLKNINEAEYTNFIIPIGGGKDSNVTLEVLPTDTSKDYCIIINPKEVTLACAKAAGFENDNIIEIKRTIDPNLIDLVKQGYINGHTPFSAMVSFTTYLLGYLTHRKYICLSNESSANESNVVGENINHQYSKSFEYEEDFKYYSSNYLKIPTFYFSFLRPLNELQIAKLFAKQKKYHQIFKSCNVGSRKEPWHWCCSCPKCLFVYIILSPFLYKEELIDIFKTDMYEDKTLLETFKGLTGHSDWKPFECVGSTEELRAAYHHRMTVPPIAIPQNPQIKNSPVTYWQPVYANLPFSVPLSNFNYLAESENQEYFKNFFENYNKRPTEQDVAFLTPSELQQQNNQKADRVLAMIERRKQLEKLRRSSKQRQRDF